MSEIRVENIIGARPFCSEKCKLIDFGTWANEENIISRPAKSEDFYED